MNLQGSSALATTNWSESLAAFLVYLVTLLVIGLLVAFITSFYFSANTIIYSLMRNKVDDTALDDIYIPPAEPILQKDDETETPDEAKTEDDNKNIK